MADSYTLYIYQDERGRISPAMLPYDQERIERFGLSLIREFKGLTPENVLKGSDIVVNHKGSLEEIISKLEKELSK